MDDRARRLEVVAIHEAGHVVAAQALGLAVRQVRISAGPGSATTLTAPPADPLADVLWRCAGPAAEALAFGTIDDNGARSDRVHADRAAFDLTPNLCALDALVARCRAEVTALLTDRWLNVEAIALALLQSSGTLKADDLSAAFSFPGENAPAGTATPPCCGGKRIRPVLARSTNVPPGSRHRRRQVPRSASAPSSGRAEH
jgi:hypothetical protein